LKQQCKYKTFLKEEAVFHNLLSIEDREVLAKIHFNYRLLFLKDTAAAHWLEEGTTALLDDVR
jgi:protein phosphatase-4 regulatory subunit 3